MEPEEPIAQAYPAFEKKELTAETLPQFKLALQKLINEYSVDTASATPDYVIAEYLMNLLMAFDVAVYQRDKWYHEHPDKV